MGEEKKINYNDNEIRTLHTYTSDMADAIRIDDTSVIKIALAEKSKREKEELYKKDEGTPFVKTLLLIGGLILVGGSLVGIYFLYKNNQNKNTPPSIVLKNYSIIPFDSESHIDTTKVKIKNDLAELIKKELEKPQANESVRKINLEVNVENKNIAINKDSLFQQMQLSAPGRLTRSIKEDYMIGSYKSHLFFLFESNDTEQSYTGLLEWEKTFLSDLYPFFSIEINENNKFLLSKPLEDTIIANIDTRVLVDQTKKSILYYSIIDKNKIIVTDNPEVIKEVINRLLIKK